MLSLRCRSLFALFVAVCVLCPVRSLAAEAGGASHVQASLVAADESIQPGKPFHVALRLQHDPHWHTYWLNPGTGLVSSLEWALPPGFTASEILWPAPVVLKDRTGTVIGNGYEGETFLPVRITPPADLKPGTTIELKARAQWLMCEEVCMPGEAPVALSLRVAAEAPNPDAQWGGKVSATVAGLPRADAAWKVVASRAGKNIRLTVTPVAAGGHVPADLHFFADDNLVAYELPQTVKADASGGLVLTLPVSPDGPKDAKKLLGVLIAKNGWLADGTLRGLRIETPFVAAAAVATPIGKLFGTLALAFLGGLVLNLMPCVFPVLGIKILGFVNQSGHERAKVIAHGLVFTLGVLLSFWSLAGALAILRAGGHELGWGFQLQEPVFVFALAAVMLVFAMSMSGVFEFGLSATGVGSNLQMKSGLLGSFFTGVLATVVATPCSAPFLAPALGAALAVPTGESFIIFTAIALGLSMPYLLLSIFPAAVKMLPRPGAWMETFKQFMSFPLYATVGALVWVLTAQVGDDALMAIIGLVLIAMAVWVYGRWTAPGASEGRRRFGVIGLVVLVCLGAWAGWPRASAIAWEPWSPEAVEKLRADGRIVYVDFTALWCATCQTNKKIVFHSDEVLKTFADKKIATLRADWTKKDPRITAELAKYNRSAVPFNVIWFPGREEPVILPELLTPGTVLDALRSGETQAVTGR
ncbi:MAG TPA: protein-disulfide reductase DsbD domain-containing protein [Opitutaceae bacterium]|nr:protein-disulfide reductase DsbD domain-containing protein [Opitutaceae bacterium]